MSRTENPESVNRVSLHVVGRYNYASTQPYTIDPVSGKKKYGHVHWGTVDESMCFIPGHKYRYATQEERSKLIFPASWDMSEAERLSDIRKPGRPAYDGEDANRFYGDIWLLEQVAMKTGIRQDLEKVFDGNKEIVDDIMTLAMFPYLTRFTYNRVARWQRIVKSPSQRELTPPDITYLTQNITEKHRLRLLKLRAAKLGKAELCAVDSTTRSAYGRSLTDIRWGKSKEQLPLEQTTEVVVYTLSNHMPVYYRTFPGNIPDSRSLETIQVDLEHASFANIILLTDRGYESLKNLERYIIKGQAMIMGAKIQQSWIMDRLLEFGDFGTRPEGMEIDKETRLYYKQYDIEYNVESIGNHVKASERLKLNLYFDPIRRGEELLNLEIEIKEQKEALDAMLAEKAVLDDTATIRCAYCYHKVSYDPASRAIQSYELNEKKVAKTKRISGFFAIVTHKLDMNALAVLSNYRLRDEQEKYFQQMKDQMSCDRQRNWSEEGKTGRLFILFVSLILSSYIRNIWKTTELKKRFSSSLEVLDEMRSIRCIEHTGRTKFIAPFVGMQIDICNVFGFDIPEGCSPAYSSKQKIPKRRGRPKKKVVESNS